MEITNDAASLTRKLFARATELGLSDRKLSQLSGVGHATISHLRQGRRAPNMTTFVALAKTVGFKLILSRTP